MTPYLCSSSELLWQSKIVRLLVTFGVVSFYDCLLVQYMSARICWGMHVGDHCNVMAWGRPWRTENRGPIHKVTLGGTYIGDPRVYSYGGTIMS